MRHIDHEFDGQIRPLSCTARAVFEIYDAYGYTTDIIGDLHLAEPTDEGWYNLCWIYALFAREGELQRRLMGEDPRPMLTMEDVRLRAMPTEASDIRQAVADALTQGFTRATAKEDEEVDLVLQDIESRTKKEKASGKTALATWLLARLSSISPSGRRSS